LKSVLLENNSQTLSYLNHLKGLGVRLALDDFGTGYSSINYLTYLPVDKIKLDKSINDKFLNLEDNNVIASIISLAHSLNFTITAEGIEDWDKYDKLKEAGCDYFQGYLFSKPVTPFEIEEIYHKNMLANK
jgi:EAL domain-containing protein (putative c-di-GMP-specific phosphodiesterase class I)